MTTISSIHAARPRNPHIQNESARTRSRADATTFTRKPNATETAPGVDKATLSPADLAAELCSLFPNAGTYAFAYGGHQCRVRVWESGRMDVSGPVDRLVEIENGAIVHAHILQNDLSAFLSTARQAQ